MNTEEFRPFDIVRNALNAEYSHLLPQGYIVHLVAEYDPRIHSAPNLHFEKFANPDARYIVIILSDWASVPALGVTVNDALRSAILKAEHRDGVRQ